MKILVAYTETNELDNAVLELAKKYARRSNSSLYIANSMERVADSEIAFLKKIEEKLETLKETIRKEGIPCSTHLLIRGLSPGEDIVKFAKDEKIDRIYIGIEKVSKLGKFIFGSNAQHIILEAPCPVISVNKDALSNLQFDE